MRVLFVCHRLPFPPSRGGKIRPFNIIRHLAERGDEVTVASLARSDAEARDGEGLARHCADRLIGRVNNWGAMLRMLVRLPTPVPSSMGYFYSRTLEQGVARLLEERSYDLVFVHCSSVAQYVEQATGMRKVLDFGDMDSQKWLAYRTFKPFPLSLGYWLEGRKLEHAEARLARRFDLTTCTTRLEFESLRAIAPECASNWFPNGVDSDYFAPQGADYDPNLICFVGRMDYFPNQQCMFAFCREVLPRLQASLPELKLQIVGAQPSTAIRALARLPGVTVTGSVPDVRPFVRRSALSVVPLLIARGTQNKILESMALGVPVIASTQAAGGVDAIADEHLLVADTPAEVCRRVLEVVSDPRLRGRLAEAGRARMLSNHSWPQSMRRLEKLLEGFRVSSVDKRDVRDAEAAHG